MRTIIITKFEMNAPKWIINNEDFYKEGVSDEELDLNIMEQVFCDSFRSKGE